ncbi:unnamed protein product [Camellia sinensis]
MRFCCFFSPFLGSDRGASGLCSSMAAGFGCFKVSQHPTVVACHCEGKGWKFWVTVTLEPNFGGHQFSLTLLELQEFDDGVVFQWSKVTTSICNLILGKVYLNHYGTMHIRGNHQYSCKLKLKEQSILDRNPHQVHGFVKDAMGKKVAALFGK